MLTSTKKKTKIEDNMKKENDALKKQKALVEVELQTSCKESKNKDDERMTILRIFDGMQEVMGKINSLNKDSTFNGQENDFTCGICAYKSNIYNDVKKHREEQHPNPPVYYLCSVCDTN